MMTVLGDFRWPTSGAAKSIRAGSRFFLRSTTHGEGAGTTRTRLSALSRANLRCGLCFVLATYAGEYAFDLTTEAYSLSGKYGSSLFDVGKSAG